MKWNNWTLVGIGLWTILSPWILGFSSLNLVVWNVVLIGSLTIVFALWNFTPSE